MPDDHGDSSHPAGTLDTISGQLSRILQMQEEALRQKDQELESLKRRVEEQQRELLWREAAIRRLEQEDSDSWEQQQQQRTTLDLGTLIRRHVNPYQTTTNDSSSSSYSPNNNGTYSPQHLGRRRRRSSSPPPMRTLDIVYGTILLALTFHYFTSSPIPPPYQLYPIDTPKTKYAETTTIKEVKPIKPWESTPPKPIALQSVNEPFLQLRHTCIQAVRDKQLDIFQKFLSSDQQILLVDPAYHGNVGDHMLTLGELHLVQKSLQLGEPKQCHYVQANYFYDICTDVVQTSSRTAQKVALWHAGGNWGDLWRDAQDVRIPSFKTILENGYTIIGLPQSLYYGDEELKQKDVTEIKGKIALGLGLGEVFTIEEKDEDEEDSHRRRRHRHNDDYWWDPKPPKQFVNTSALDTPKGLALARQKITFMWREKESWQEASKLYPFVSNVLVPDMAFQLGPYQPIRKHAKKMVDIIIFLRKDHESQVDSQRNSDSIRAMLPNKHLSFRIVDWADRLELFDTTDTFFTDTSIQLLSLGKVVVCDRLHAAILAYLSGLPFVYIDQVSGKVSKTLNAAFEGTTEGCLDEEKSKWARATTLKEALAKATQMIESDPSLSSQEGFLRGILPW